MYVRKVKKSGKIYLYYYKSQRIGNKVKSVYLGKVLEKPKQEKKIPRSIKNTNLINNLLEFDNLLFEINKSLSLKDLKSSIENYNRILNIYSRIDISISDKEKLFNKLNLTYNELVNLSKEHNIRILE